MASLIPDVRAAALRALLLSFLRDPVRTAKVARAIWLSEYRKRRRAQTGADAVVDQALEESAADAFNTDPEIRARVEQHLRGFLGRMYEPGLAHEIEVSLERTFPDLAAQGRFSVRIPSDDLTGAHVGYVLKPPPSARPNPAPDPRPDGTFAGFGDLAEMEKRVAAAFDPEADEDGAYLVPPEMAEQVKQHCLPQSPIADLFSIPPEARGDADWFHVTPDGAIPFGENVELDRGIATLAETQDRTFDLVDLVGLGLVEPWVLGEWRRKTADAMAAQLDEEMLASLRNEGRVEVTIRHGDHIERFFASPGDQVRPVFEVGPNGGARLVRVDVEEGNPDVLGNVLDMSTGRQLDEWGEVFDVPRLEYFGWPQSDEVYRERLRRCIAVAV